MASDISASSLINQAINLQKQKRFEEAGLLYIQAASATRASGSFDDAAKIIRAAGNCYAVANKKNEANRIFTSVIEGDMGVGVRPAIVASCRALRAFNAVVDEKYDWAVEELRLVDAVLRRETSSAYLVEHSQVLGSMGDCLHALNRPKEAVDAWDRSISSWQRVTDESARPKHYAAKIAGIRSQAIKEYVGDHKLAVDAFLFAASLYAESRENEDCARCLVDAGSTEIKLRNFERGLSLFSNAIAIFAQLGQTENVAGCKYACSEALMKLNRFEEANSAVIEARLVFLAKNISASVAACDRRLAEIKRSMA